ncbi:sigma factor-like helix-turn-helix DNA-binding protein [Streptomyces sp. NPDC093586]|uniref:sigma factor-like helix-turn-helix DNA-binding protein n=1 Tax=Streptomyces sp. NPDC093586 TaxID=3366042 RepID=UPI0038290FF4
MVGRESVEEAVRRLPSRERAVLHPRFFEDWSQSRVVRRTGGSRTHVPPLPTRTCARVRHETPAAR